MPWLLIYYLHFLYLQVGITQSSTGFSAQELDSLLQECAFKAVVARPKTGLIYEGKVPPSLAGVQVAALRLRSGSLRRKGFESYKEFRIPVGIIEQPYVERVVLVYHNLANRSSLYYTLPGYTFLTPVLGLLTYDASNLSAANLSQLNVRASSSPISIEFKNLQSWPKGSSPKCVHFGLDGSVVFDNVVNGTTCSTKNQGHFSIVVESSIAPPPAAGGDGGEVGWSKKTVVVVGCVVGGVVVVLLGFVGVGYVMRSRARRKIRRMEEVTELELPLPMTSVGWTKAPAAAATRTGPLLENRFVP